MQFPVRVTAAAIRCCLFCCAQGLADALFFSFLPQIWNALQFPVRVTAFCAAAIRRRLFVASRDEPTPPFSFRFAVVTSTWRLLLLLFLVIATADIVDDSFVWRKDSFCGCRSIILVAPVAADRLTTGTLVVVRPTIDAVLICLHRIRNAELRACGFTE